MALSSSGLDVYDHPIAPVSRIADILLVLRKRHFITPFSALIGVTATVGGLSLLPHWSREQRVGIRRASFWLAVLCLLYASQLVFYNANWPVTVMRYGFPGLLYYPASVLIFYRLGRDMLAGRSPEDALQFALKASLVASLAVVIVYHEGYAGAIRAMQANVAETREFTDRLGRLAARLNQDDSLQLVVESTNVWDYELVFGYPRFLRAFQARNPMLLRLHGYGIPSYPAGRERRLATELEAISSGGNSDYLPLSFVEEEHGRCLSFFLGAEGLSGCEMFR
jgi:hypothetical protein